ncbi:uncharacterized protein STEHIDRAFT_163799 [Stereum hirsutum FP-91666 SS1]|uniref:Uncharacterized protein n=1 Tax=Stereum hirsutum (strain FP-91666) TaxID=721885 RepID=R7RWU4_STEHR|nr:uncharacterized protein STEHIDRAFT_163799 [Stereum hirsutum FP-91666 SS1]EIM79273.1 hypothetical protein STEHIDRAFT_163799 [Stereum hirsutum FP-91666 SS1]
MPLNMSLGVGLSGQAQNTLPSDSARYDPIIANATHDGLVRVGNLAHQQVCYQLMQAQVEMAKLKKEVDRLSWNRNAYDSLIAQLLGGDRGAATIVSLPTGGEDSKDVFVSSSVPSLSISLQQCPAHVVLGLGMKALTPPTRAECPDTRFWAISDWNSFTKPAAQTKKGGNHSVLYTELSHQQADDMRVCIYSLFLSLASTGQAPSQSGSLGHEALEYIHGNLATAFPPLLRCEGGHWKIDKLISQLYSNWWRDRGKKYIPPAGHDNLPLPKREASEAPMPETPAPKRPRPAAPPAMSTIPRPKSRPSVNPQEFRRTDQPKPTSIPSVSLNVSLRPAEVIGASFPFSITFEFAPFNIRPTSTLALAPTDTPSAIPSAWSDPNMHIPSSLPRTSPPSTPSTLAIPCEQELRPFPTSDPPATATSTVDQVPVLLTKTAMPLADMDVDSLSATPSHPAPRPIHAEADEHKASQPPISPRLKPAVVANEANPGAIREDATVLNEADADVVLSAARDEADTNKSSVTPTGGSTMLDNDALTTPATPLLPMDIPQDVVKTALSKEPKAAGGSKKKGGRGGQGKLAKDYYDNSDYKEKSVKLGLWLTEHPEGLQAVFEKEYSKYLTLPLDNISRVEVWNEMKQRADTAGVKPRKQTQSKASASG